MSEQITGTVDSQVMKVRCDTVTNPLMEVSGKFAAMSLDRTRCSVYLSGVARKPFNPDDAIGGLFDQAPEAEKPAPVKDSASMKSPKQVEAPARVEITPLTPSSLNQRVKDVLERGIPGPLEVVGELSNLKRQGLVFP